MGDPAAEDEAPDLRVALVGVAEAEALEGDAHEDDVAEGGASSPGVPDGVEGEVWLAIVFTPGSVGLDAEWVGLEEKATAVVVEGVECDFDFVVVVDLVAGGEVCADEGGILVAADEGEVKVEGGVSDVG